MKKNPVRSFFLMLIVFYQKTLSFDHGPLKHIFPFYGCRFYPSCSDYSYQAITKKGLILGIFLTIKRLLKCNPFNSGGYDPLLKKMANISKKNNYITK